MSTDVLVLRPFVADMRSSRWIVGTALLCGLAALLSLVVSDARPGQLVIWMANPVGAVALLLLNRKQWLRMLMALLLAMWSAHIAYALVAAPQFLRGGALWSAVGLAGLDVPAHVLEMLLAAVFLRRVPSLEHAGDRLPLQAKALFHGAVLPAAFLAPLGGALWGSLSGVDWQVSTLNWLTGHLIGSVAALPLALAIAAKPSRVALRFMTEPLTLGNLLGCVAVTLWAGTSLPDPFVIMAAPMVWMAARTGLVATFVGNALIATSIALLIRYGILSLPPTSSWWGDALFYLSVLATLLPGLFLAVMSEGQRLALYVLAESEARAKDQYFQTPAILHSIDAEGRIIQVSKLWLDTLGYSVAEVLGRHVTDFMTPASALRAREVVIPKAVRVGRCDNIEYQLCKKDGGLCDVLLSAIWEYGTNQKPLRSLAVLQDVTEKKRLEARSHFAEHDPLTGLPNRVLLQDRLKMLCAHHSRHSGMFAVGFLDLDHFKDVNDNYGHDAGDALLTAVAHRLQSSLRASDTVCRLGGDEFVMIFSALEGHEELHALTNKVMTTIHAPYPLGRAPGDPVVEVSGSLGVSIFPAHGEDPQTLIMHADQAMYSAKRSGRNRCEFYRNNVG